MTFRVTVRRFDDPFLRWHAIVEHCPESDPAAEFPRGCSESPPLFAFTRAGVERKVQRWIAKRTQAKWPEVETLTIPWPGPLGLPRRW